MRVASFIILLTSSLAFANSESICSENITLTGKIVTSCKINEKSYANSLILKIDYQNTRVVPALIKQQLPPDFIRQSGQQNISCLYRMKFTNDNIAGIQKLNLKDGNDYGRTHGVEFGASCFTQDGLNHSFIYSTDLFTERMKDTYWNQHSSKDVNFTSENIFTYLQDNIRQGKASYWKRGVGFINLTNKLKWDLAQSTGQQMWFHEIMNSIVSNSARDYIYHEGSKDKWGAFIVLAIGLHEKYLLEKQWFLTYSAEVGVRAATLRGSSQIFSTLSSKLTYMNSSSRFFYLRGQSTMTSYLNSSRIIENTIAIGTESKRGVYMELAVLNQNGRRASLQDIDDDLLVQVVLGYRQ